MPRFTIFSPTRNAGPYVVKCIESVLGQSFTDWELFYISDASDDATFPLALGYSLTDNRVHVVSNPVRVGSVQNFLNVFPQMRGDIIVQLDGDDWFSSPDSLAIIDSYYRQDEEVEATNGTWQPSSTAGCTSDRNITYERLWRFRDGRGVAHPARTWQRPLTARFLQERPSFMLDANGKLPDRVFDVVVFSHAIWYARKIATVREIVYTINLDNPLRDHKLIGPAPLEQLASHVAGYWIELERVSGGGLHV